MLRSSVFAVAAFGLVACGPAPEKSAGHDAHMGAASSTTQEPNAKAELPTLALTPAQAASPQVAAINRTVTVALPVKLADNQAWVAAAPMAELGPFMFHGLEENPGAGPNGADLVVFTYMAHEPGAGVLKFARVPAGISVIGAGAKPDAALETVEFAVQAK
jgi:hypothetical protein